MTRRAPLAALVVAAVAAAVLGADRLAPPPTSAASSGPSVEIRDASDQGPTGGASTCAVGDGREGTELGIVATRPGQDGDPPARVEVETFDGEPEGSLVFPPLFPGASDAADIDGSQQLASSVRWSRAPVAIDRSWRLDADDLPPGRVAGPCASATARRSVIPGLITSGGHEAVLRLANPFPEGATVAVGFLTPTGPEDPLALQNLSVGGHDTLEIPVTEVLPEQDDLAAVIEVRSGRVAAEGYQLTRAEVGGIAGASLLASAPEPATSWTVPWVADGEDVRSWLWVTNPTERSTTIETTVHTPDGARVPDGFGEVDLAPGEVRRLDLRGVIPDDAPAAAATVRADRAPVVASSAVELDAPDTERTGFTVLLGTPVADDRWALGATDAGQRDEQLRLVNPGTESATVDVSVFANGSVSRPDELTEIEIPPGAVRAVSLTEEVEGASAWSAVVTASAGEVVVGRVGRSGSGPLEAVAAPATPASSWAPEATRAGARFEPGLVRRLDTSLGIASGDPLDAEEPGESDPDEPDGG